MTRTLSLALILFGFLAVLAPQACAQEPHHPRISVAHPGITQLKADLKLLLDLGAEDERHWQNWDELIELFAFGLDYDRPLLLSFFSGLTPAPTMIYGAFAEPVNDLLDDNIGANWFPEKVTDELYELLPPEQGWFRILPDEKFAILILSTESDHNILKQLVLKAVNPVPVINEVLKDSANVGFQLLNAAQTDDDQKKRRDSFAEIRAVRMDALEKRPKESQTEFELRQGLLSVNLDELERLMVESSSLTARAILNAEALSAKVIYDSEGIPGTSLAKSLDLFNKHEDAFASVERAEGSALSVRINHPIDELRQQSGTQIIELMRNDVADRLKSNETMSAEQKTATQELFDGVMEVVTDGLKSGNLNAFMQSVPSGEDKFTSWGATVSVEPKRLDEVLKLIAKTGDGNEVSIALETVGSVSIHRIKLKKGFLKAYDSVFGEDAAVYIGTSENMVWFGAGPDALEPLKKAITDLKEPAESDVVLRAEGDLLPWAKYGKKLVEGLPKPVTVDDEQTRRDVLLRFTQAVASLKDADDDVTFDMNVEEGKLTGELSVNTGLLRFIGTQLETFSKNNLE